MIFLPSHDVTKIYLEAETHIKIVIIQMEEQWKDSLICLSIYLQYLCTVRKEKSGKISMSEIRKGKLWLRAPIHKNFTPQKGARH
jgi:hypothetical protein